MKELGQGPHDLIATTGEDINSRYLDTAPADSRDLIEKQARTEYATMIAGRKTRR